MPAKTKRSSSCASRNVETEEAITACLGLELSATAQPAGLAEPTGPGAAFAAPPSMAAPVPGQTFEVRARLANRGRRPVAPAEVTIEVKADGLDGDGLGCDGHRGVSGAARRARSSIHRGRGAHRAHQHEAVPPPERASRRAATRSRIRRSSAALPGSAARRRGPLRGRGLAGDDARGGEAPRGQAALRRRAARGAQRAAPRRHRVARGRRDSARQHEQARGAHGGRRAQRRGGDDRRRHPHRAAGAGR